MTTDRALFEASWGRFVKLMTWLSFVVTVLGEAVIVVLIVVFSSKSPPVACLFAAIGAFGPVALWFSSRLRPRGYVVDPQGVTVLRRMQQFGIPFQEITQVELVDGNQVLKRALPILASSGAFGMYGLFRNQEGRFRAYITRKDPLVKLTRREGMPVYLSPDDVAAFVTRVQQGMGASGQATD